LVTNNRSYSLLHAYPIYKILLFFPFHLTSIYRAFKDYKVVFTGHSLGGALAALAAARTAKQGLRPGEKITMYTYGEPRVGDAQFATNFDTMIKDSYRVVFRRDIVPHLPACAKDKAWFGDGETSRPCDINILNKPYHHSTEIWYPDSMEPGSHYIECTGEPRGEDFTCSDKLKFYYDQSNSYIWDHRHYFTVRVPEYGKTGCDVAQPEGKPGLFENVVNRLNLLTRTIVYYDILISVSTPEEISVSRIAMLILLIRIFPTSYFYDFRVLA
ncbi:triacylglycerol lipase, partial [Teladorsagia circumcincta]